MKVRKMRLRQILILLTVQIIVIFLGVVDWATGYDLNFFVFYFAPVALAAWKLGAGAGYVTAIVSGMVWHVADWASGHQYSAPFYEYWNAALRTISFLVISFSTARIHQLEQQAQRKVQQLSGLLPICAWCKKIRNDHGYWERVEEYIQHHSDAQFTHSICDECAKKQWNERELLDLDGRSPSGARTEAPRNRFGEDEGGFHLRRP
jgi:hypothetical protein